MIYISFNLLHVCIANIFCSVGYFFPQLMVSFDEQKFLAVVQHTKFFHFGSFLLHPIEENFANFKVMLMLSYFKIFIVLPFTLDPQFM